MVSIPEEEEAIRLEIITINGKKFLKSKNTVQLYDYNLYMDEGKIDEIGVLDPINNRILERLRPRTT